MPLYKHISLKALLFIGAAVTIKERPSCLSLVKANSPVLFFQPFFQTLAAREGLLSYAEVPEDAGSSLSPQLMGMAGRIVLLALCLGLLNMLSVGPAMPLALWIYPETGFKTKVVV